MYNVMHLSTLLFVHTTVYTNQKYSSTIPCKTDQSPRIPLLARYKNYYVDSLVTLYVLKERTRLMESASLI